MKDLFLISVIIVLTMLPPIVYAGVDKSLVLYLPFNEGAGDVAKDSSQYGNEGTMMPKGNWVDGKYGKGIQVTASQGHVEIPPSDSLSPDIFVGSFTLNGWIKPALTGDQWQHIWRSRPVESGHNTLFVNTGGFLSWRGMAPAWTVLCEGVSGDVKADEWSFFAMVSDEKKFKMFVNDKMVKDASYMVTNGKIATFYVGGDGQSENYTGAIDEVCVWNRALSDDEIKTIYTKGLEAFMAVDLHDKLSTTWGGMKTQY